MNRSNKCEINTNNFNVTKHGILIIRSTQPISASKLFKNKKILCILIKNIMKKKENDIMRFLHVLDSYVV